MYKNYRLCTACLWASICAYADIFRGQKPEIVDSARESIFNEEEMEVMRNNETLETLNAPNVRFFVPNVWYNEDLIRKDCEQDEVLGWFRFNGGGVDAFVKCVKEYMEDEF
jgi:hypothetical protein